MGTIHVYGAFIVPGGSYEIAVLDGICDMDQINDPAASPPLALYTSEYGDVCGPMNPEDIWGPPDGSPDWTRDILAVKQKFGNKPSLTKARAELGAAIGDPEPDLIIDISKDAFYAKEAFQRRPYDMFFPPPPWPCP